MQNTKNFYLKFWAFVLISCSQITAIIAQGVGFAHLDDAWALDINPAHTPKNTLTIMAGGIDLQVGNDGFSINQIGTSSNPVTRESLENLSRNMGTTNQFFLDTRIKTLGLAVKLGKYTIHAGHQFRQQSYLSYTRDLFDLAAFGNAAYLDQTLDIGPSLSHQLYNELYLGGSVDLGRVSIGGTLRKLNGVENAFSNKTKLNLYTNPEFYQITLDYDLEYFGSRTLELDNLDNLDVDLNRGVNFRNFLINNNGWSVDLGLGIKLNEATSMFVSARDLGTITWDRDPRRYTKQGSKTFEGINLADYLTISDGVSIEDSIESLIDLDVDRPRSYNAPIVGRYSLGITHQMEDARLGALFEIANTPHHTRRTLHLSAQKKLKNLFTLGMSWSIRERQWTNIGALVIFDLGPIHAMVAADNLWAIVQPRQVRGFGLQTGFALKF